MQAIFEEIDWQKTALGEISLRKRSEPRLNHKLIYEVKLNEEFLMSSLFVEAEEQLSLFALEKMRMNGLQSDLNVVVGGLGLGYTALTALNNPAVSRLRTIDVMPAVISWHRKGLLPIGDVLASDPRSELIEGDFFQLAIDEQLGFLDDEPVHAVLLDIDHSPSHWLNEGNSKFYSESSLQAMAAKIRPNGVFGLWSNDLPDEAFKQRLELVFDQVDTHIVRFENPYSGGESTNSLYIGSKAAND